MPDRDLFGALGQAIDAAREDRRPNSDCLLVKRGEEHDAHSLAGPGGNKPGARCGGIPPAVQRADRIGGA